MSGPHEIYIQEGESHHKMLRALRLSGLRLAQNALSPQSYAALPKEALLTPRCMLFSSEPRENDDDDETEPSFGMPGSPAQDPVASTSSRFSMPPPKLGYRKPCIFQVVIITYNFEDKEVGLTIDVNTPGCPDFRDP